MATPIAAHRPLAAVATLRLTAFAGLAVFGALHWAALESPASDADLLLCAAIAIAVTVAGHRLSLRSRPWRVAAGCGLGALAVVSMLLVTGLPLTLLAPRHWGDLVAGLGDGIGALPGIGVPYSGVDPWVHITLVVGGGLLPVLAGGLTVRSLRLQRRPVGAAVALAALFVIPVVVQAPSRTALWGLVFTVLLGTLLWGDRVGRQEVGRALIFVGVALVAGLVATPRLDAARPLIDYRAIVESLSSPPAVRFDWNHGYGPLNWPRENRVMLRVSADTPSYWKLVDLDRFDGAGWRAQSSPAPGPVTETAPNHADWTTTLRVSIRDLQTTAYVAAGTGLAIERSPRYATPSAPGTFATGSQPLRRGDTYLAKVYSPHPDIRELRNAGTQYPTFVAPYLTMELPASVGGAGTRVEGAPSSLGPTVIEFPRFSLLSARLPPIAVDPTGVRSLDGDVLLARSQYAQLYALAHRLRVSASSPYDYLRLIQTRLSHGYAYTEKPPTPAPGRPPLVSFVFDTHAGYCQQFSGAMALLLRMGGVPARVGSGFTPGTLDTARGEWVVRDVDAHSWVEAYFPQLGWVTLDPTPGVAPPRTQLLNEPAPPGAKQIPLRSDSRRADVPGRRSGAGGPGSGGARVSPWLLLLAGVLGGSAAAAALVLLQRRRDPDDMAPELAELQRALRRTGRTPRADLTLAALERRFAATAPDAAAYVAAVRLTRFGGRAQPPTARERAALRSELAAGLGWHGRMRAWWAIPPARLRPRRFYTDG